MKRKQSCKNNRTLLVIKDIALWVVGGALYALAINVFTAPNDIIIGGFSGIATMLNYLFGLPIGTVIFLMNIPFFIIAFRKFGSDFIIKTIIATFIASSLIDVSSPFLLPYSGDRLLAAVFGGVFAGAGLGLVFLSGATTGGVDIIAKLLRLKFQHVSMGKVILFLDLAVIAASFLVYRSVESLLYALIVIFVSSQAIDYTISGSDNNKLILIVSEKADEIAKKILTDLRRGVTIIPVCGGYTNKEKKMLFCAVRANEVSGLSKAVREIDDGAFTVITRADEILGEGFKRRKI